MSAVGLEILVIAILLLANGVFAMAEIAVVTARKAKLRQWAEQGDARAGSARSRPSGKQMAVLCRK